MGVGLAEAGCDNADSTLAPYEGGRALDLLEVTQRFMPEVQWVGGRVAAVGVNRGTRAALDSTLVWLRTAPDNSIGSFVTVGEGGDDALVLQYGGTPQSRLTDGETYTVWLAERSAFDADLDSTRIDPTAFVDSTLTMGLLLRGRSGGGLGVAFEIERDERLTGEQFVVRWTPSDAVFRRLAIREAPIGGFEDLIWHLLSPEAGPPLIAAPVTIGVPPAGVQEVTPFPEAGFPVDDVFNPEEERDDPKLDFDPPVHTLWAVTDAWNQSFSPAAPGYAFFQIFACNFDIDEPCQ